MLMTIVTEKFTVQASELNNDAPISLLFDDELLEETAELKMTLEEACELLQALMSAVQHVEE
jgi:hypothetical protein